jgi:hypothetical protein
MHTHSCLVARLAYFATLMTACGGRVETRHELDGAGSVDSGVDAAAVKLVDGAVPGFCAPSSGAEGRKVAAPTFGPPGGTYYWGQSINIASPTPDATIYYTLDGNEPNAGSAKFTGPLWILHTSTIRALACAEGYFQSEVNSATYTIEYDCVMAASPVISPPGGTFTSAQTVTMTTTEPGGKIFYTTNGTLPTKTNGTLYTSAILVAAATTFVAVTIVPNHCDPNPTTATFKF